MEINFFGRVIQIEYLPKDHKEFVDGWAKWDDNNDTILLSEGIQDEQQELLILFHEIWHVCFPNDEEKEVDQKALIMFECLWKNDMIGWPKK